MYSPTVYLRTIVSYALLYLLAAIVAWLAHMPRRRLGRREGFWMWCAAWGWIVFGIILITG